MDIVESGMRDVVFTKVDLVVRCVQGPPWRYLLPAYYVTQCSSIVTL